MNAKKVWQWPHQSEILIFDACGQEILLEYVRVWNPEVLHLRNESLNVPVMLASLFRPGRKSDAYIDCFIEKVSPKLVVTMIDNNSTFYNISGRHSSVKTMFIQNGCRGYYADIFEVLNSTPSATLNTMMVDYIMPFSSTVCAEFSRYIKGDVVPIGSFKNNHLPITDVRQNDVVAYASQWRKNGFFMSGKFYTHKSFFRQTDQPVIQLLAKYAREKDKRLMVILCNHKSALNRASEKAYFRELAGDDVTFFESVEAYSSYQALDVAGVVVGVDTTLVYEAIARGTKAAIFSIRSDLLGLKGFTYGWPGEYLDDGPFWTNHANLENFERIMDHLFEIDDEQWQTELAKYSFDKVLKFDPGNGILKAVLTKELGIIPDLS